MTNRFTIKIGFCGLVAGIINGLLGAGGGILLVPLLMRYSDLGQEDIFPSSVCIMLPICLTSLLAYGFPELKLLMDAIPYMLGGVIGGILAWRLDRKIPVKWIHRAFGLLILWGGVQRLW